MLKGLALDYFYSNCKNCRTVEQYADSIKSYFEGEEHKRTLLRQWNSLTLSTIIERSSSEGKTTEESLQLLIKELRHIQHGLDWEFRTENSFHNKLIIACQEVPACKFACYKPSPTVAGLINDLRSSIVTYEKGVKPTQAFFTDRRFHNSRSYNPRPEQRSNNRFTPIAAGNRYRKKGCLVCNKEGCWSSNHTPEERERAKTRYKERVSKRVDQYITEWDEREPNLDTELEEDMEVLLIEEGPIDSQDQEQNDFSRGNTFLTSFGNVNGRELAEKLADQSAIHTITKDDKVDDTDPFTYTTFEGRYNSKEFYGIMIDTGASTRSTAGYGQYLAYKSHKNVDIDKSRAGEVNVQFGIGSISSIGSITVLSPFGAIEFHIVRADTPFLLCIKDMDDLRIQFNNLTNRVICKGRSLPVVRRFGHPFLIWEEFLTCNFLTCYLTDTELRQIHRRFGHPSANRLIKLLERSGHESNRRAVERLTKFCHYCQKHGKSPGRFKFTLKNDDIDFNHSVFVDIMYIDNNPLLHIVDEATRFQAARWLQNISAKHTWDILRLCWIDVYVGPPDLLIHDAGKNFTSQEFRQLV
jgi:hypothetical protein